MRALKHDHEVAPKLVAPRDPNAATHELDILERPANTVNESEYALNRHRLSSSPIRADWILEGSPATRNKLMQGSTDGMASTYMWDCTAGRFDWHYDIDETVYLLEGSVVLKDSSGKKTHLKAGDTFLFPAGSIFEWTVSSYVRKVAFFHAPMSQNVRLVKRLFKAATGMLGSRAKKDSAHTL